jgi:hypothetical protein
MKLLKILLFMGIFSSLFGCGNNNKTNNENDFEHKSFEINGRTIEYKTKVVDKIEQDLLKLSDKDKEFIAYCLVDAEILLKQLAPNKDLSNYSAADLDELISLWKHKRTSFKLVQEDEFANAMGAAFGNCLNKTVGTTWTIISDEYGTDYACVSENPQFQTFPFSSVWKAIEENDGEGKLTAIITVVQKHIEEGTWNK